MTADRTRFMKRKERTFYSQEFKLEALRLVAIGDRPKTHVARELGIRVNKLRYWRLEFKEEEKIGLPKGTHLEKDVSKDQPEERIAKRSTGTNKKSSSSARSSIRKVSATNPPRLAAKK